MNGFYPENLFGFGCLRYDDSWNATTSINNKFAQKQDFYWPGFDWIY